MISFKHLTRGMIATTAAAALCVGLGTATPAAAQTRGNDIAGFLAGATALVIIGSALNAASRDDDHRGRPAGVRPLPNNFRPAPRPMPERFRRDDHRDSHRWYRDDRRDDHRRWDGHR